MTFIQTWVSAFVNSLQNVWFGVADFLPKLIIAFIIFAIGWVLAALIEKLVESIFKSLKIDSALKNAGLEDAVKRSGHTLNSGVFVGSLIKWFIIVVFLMSAFDTIGLKLVNDFLQNMVGYLPRIIVSVLILMVAVVVANAMHKLVVASSRAAHVRSAELLGRLTKWSIWIFAILAALYNLGVAQGLIETVVMAVFAGVAIAIGLAFGLGGKEAAQKWIEKTSANMMEKE